MKNIFQSKLQKEVNKLKNEFIIYMNTSVCIKNEIKDLVKTENNKFLIKKHISQLNEIKIKINDIAGLIKILKKSIKAYQKQYSYDINHANQHPSIFNIK